MIVKCHKCNKLFERFNCGDYQEEDGCGCR